MIDSTNLMLVAIPTSGLQAPTTEHSVRRPTPSDLGIKYEPGERITVAPNGFAPVKGQTIYTENGYVVHIPNMCGSSTNVTKLGGGYYLVTTKPSVYGAKPKKTVMTEEELVERFHGRKLPMMPEDDDKTTEAKLQRAILQLLTTDPKICYQA